MADNKTKHGTCFGKALAQQVEERGDVVVLRNDGGNRVTNLENIADEIDVLMRHDRPEPVQLSHADAHRLKGYAEQLRLIADEINDSKIAALIKSRQDKRDAELCVA